MTRNKEPWIGQAVPRVEDAALLSGNARYIDDLSPVPGIKHVCFLRSPYPHAKLIDIDISAAAKASGALDAKTKELIAIAIAVAVRCDGCIAAHTKAAEKYGVDREEILEALSMAVYMGGGPSVVYASQALDSFDAFSTQSD